MKLRKTMLCMIEGNTIPTWCWVDGQSGKVGTVAAVGTTQYSMEQSGERASPDVGCDITEVRCRIR